MSKRTPQNVGWNTIEYIVIYDVLRMCSNIYFLLMLRNANLITISSEYLFIMNHSKTEGLFIIADIIYNILIYLNISRSRKQQDALSG